VIVKGAPENVLARCANVAPGAQAVLDREFAAGSRVIAVATRPADDRTTLNADDERDLHLAGFLTFVDRPKADAGEALERLKTLDVQVKIITGDNDRVAQKVCAEIGASPSTGRSPEPRSIKSTTRNSRLRFPTRRSSRASLPSRNRG